MAEDKTCLIGMDIGTTGIKAVIIDAEKGFLASAGKEHYYTFIDPVKGYTEFNTESWWDITKEIIPEALTKAKVTPSDVKGICISALMPCITPVDKEGNSLKNGIIWQDSRAPKDWSPLQQNNPLFGTGKVLWIKENEPEIYQKTHKFFFNGESVINAKLTGKFAENNSGDIRKKEIIVEQFKEYGLDVKKIPEYFTSTEIIGGVTKESAKEVGLAEGTPVAAGQSDGAGAWIGCGGIREGTAFIMMGHSHVMGMSGTGGQMSYATISAAGAILRWYRELFGRGEVEVAQRMGLSAYNLYDKEAERVQPGSKGLIIIPYFMGERAPMWNTKARGVFFGLNLTHTKSHIIRAILESSAYGMRNGFETGNGILPSVKEIGATGGGSQSNLWLKIYASVFGLPFVRYGSDNTCVGDAIVAGVASDVFKDIESGCDKIVKPIEVIEPDPEWQKIYDKYYPIYKETYTQLEGTFDQLAKVNV
jgi:xylulokinase